MLSDLILYRSEDNLTIRIDNYYNNRGKSDDANALVGELLTEAASHGFKGDLWHCLIANMLVNNENAYSLSCEMTGECKGSLARAAEHDFELIYKSFNDGISDLYKDAGVPDEIFTNYDNSKDHGFVYNKRIRDCIVNLAKRMEDCQTPSEMQSAVSDFYKAYGVGKFGLHKAFRIDENGEIIPIPGILHVHFDDLIGYELQKQKLRENTEAFLAGRPCNNALLFGDAGTGKSSSIKAIANEYYEAGLRIIEIYKHQLKDINSVIEIIKSRNYKFILYMDDLSFEEFETEYKYLKAVIEGGLSKKPDNVLIYATSNRQHLIRESFKDKSSLESDDPHHSDTVQEKLSLSYRFGCTIYYGAPTPKEFKAIVLGLKENMGVELDDETLLAEANKWELSHGGLSGRTAHQFMEYIQGTYMK